MGSMVVVGGHRSSNLSLLIGDGDSAVVAFGAGRARKGDEEEMRVGREAEEDMGG